MILCIYHNFSAASIETVGSHLFTGNLRIQKQTLGKQFFILKSQPQASWEPTVCRSALILRLQTC